MNILARLDFDPSLPDLPSAFSPEVAARSFAPCFGAIKDCRVLNARYEPGVRCVVTWELWVERPNALQQAIGIVEVTPAGAAYRRYDQDPLMPWLGAAADPAAAVGRWRELLRDSAARVRAVTPIRYKPGSRCVLRYDVSTSSGRQTFFAKISAGDSGPLIAALAALRQAGQAAPDMPGVLQPLGYWPELHLLIQPWVAEAVELHKFVFDASADELARDRWVRQAGAGVAALHAAHVPGAFGPCVTLEDDLDELSQYVAPVNAIAPALASRFREALDHIQTLARRRPEPAPVPSHGALRTDQFMITPDREIGRDRLVMIDLDSLCRANPARDVGNMLAYLQWRAIRRPEHAASIERVAREFMASYRAAAWLENDWVAIYQAASLCKIVGRRFRNVTFDEWALAPLLLDKVQEMCAS